MPRGVCFDFVCQWRHVVTDGLTTDNVDVTMTVLNSYCIVVHMQQHGHVGILSARGSRPKSREEFLGRAWQQTPPHQLGGLWGAPLCIFGTWKSHQNSEMWQWNFM